MVMITGNNPIAGYPQQFGQFWGLIPKPTAPTKIHAITPHYTEEQKKALELAATRAHGTHLLTKGAKAADILATGLTIHTLKEVQKEYGLTVPELKEIGIRQPIFASHSSIIREQLGLRQREDIQIIKPLARGTVEGAIAKGQLEDVSTKYLELVQAPPQQISFDWGFGGIGDKLKNVLIIGAVVIGGAFILSALLKRKGK